MLDRILAAKERRVALASASRRAAASPLSPAHRLRRALQGPGPRYIMECKAASPSAGRFAGRYDPAALADAYRSTADAVSVLTEPDFFGGALEHLDQVTRRVALPALRKDFITRPEELAEARAHGACGVLLMLSVLDDAAWRACLGACRRLGMDALTEAHDDGELERAVRLGASIIGINNRDLRTLEVDLRTTERLAPRVPPGRILVAESGIASRADVLRLAPLVDGFLIGTTLSRDPRPAHKARLLTRGRLKVCGLTRASDVRAAWEIGATLGGLIFVPGSPRRVDLPLAQRLTDAAPLDFVGVFRDHPAREIAEIATRLRLTAVQLHGREGRPCVAELRPLLPRGCAVWKVVPARLPVPSALALGVDRIVIDTGEHRVAPSDDDLALAEPAFRAVDLDACVVSGGISAANVAELARRGPWAIDVNSGVESAPGLKQTAALARLGEALRVAPGSRRQDHE